MTLFRDVTPDAAEGLVAEGAVHVLDVRSQTEFEGPGHIPGAILLPVDMLACGAVTLPRDKPLLVCCERGGRSRRAAALLACAGFCDVLNLKGGLSRWRGPRELTPGAIQGPCSWIVANLDLLPRRGRALDVACGAGRHALLLAAKGLRVRALDRDRQKIADLRTIAARLELPVEARVADLETDGVDLGGAAFDAIVVVHYLHRPLFPAIIRALKPGGLLLYETFTTRHRGKPRNRAFLLKPGELSGLVAPLDVVRRREGRFEGRHVSAVAGRKKDT